MRHLYEITFLPKGPCYQQVKNETDRCDDNGYYKPRFCRIIRRSNRIRCVCVHPINGTELLDTETTFDDSGNDDDNKLLRPKCTIKG